MEAAEEEEKNCCFVCVYCLFWSTAPININPISMKCLHCKSHVIQRFGSRFSGTFCIIKLWTIYSRSVHRYTHKAIHHGKRLPFVRVYCAALGAARCARQFNVHLDERVAIEHA